MHILLIILTLTGMEVYDADADGEYFTDHEHCMTTLAEHQQRHDVKVAMCIDAKPA